MPEALPEFDPVHIGLVSVSDRASTGVYEDKGVPALKDWLSRAVRNPVQWDTRLIPDDEAGISATLSQYYGTPVHPLTGTIVEALGGTFSLSLLLILRRQRRHRRRHHAPGIERDDLRRGRRAGRALPAEDADRRHQHARVRPALRALRVPLPSAISCRR